MSEDEEPQFSTPTERALYRDCVRLTADLEMQRQVTGNLALLVVKWMKNANRASIRALETQRWS